MVQRFWVSVILLAFLVAVLPAPESEAATECPDSEVYQTELSEVAVRLKRAGLVNSIMDPGASRLQSGPEPVTRAGVAHALAKALASPCLMPRRGRPLETSPTTGQPRLSPCWPGKASCAATRMAPSGPIGS